MQIYFPEGNGFKDGRRLGRLVRGHFTLLSLNRLADIANEMLFAFCRSTAAKVLRQTHFKANFIPLAVSDWLPSNLHFTRANLKVSVYPFVRFFFLVFFSSSFHRIWLSYQSVCAYLQHLFSLSLDHSRILTPILSRVAGESLFIFTRYAISTSLFQLDSILTSLSCLRICTFWFCVHLNWRG